MGCGSRAQRGGVRGGGRWWAGLRTGRGERSERERRGLGRIALLPLLAGAAQVAHDDRAAHYKKRTAESLKRGMRLLDSRRRREATSRDDFSTVYTSPGGG